MKKLILVFLMMAGISQLKAQQFQFKGADSLSNKALDKLLKIKPDRVLILLPKLNLDNTLNNSNINILNSIRNSSSIEHMPVAVLTGNDKMPIAGFEGYSKMPVMNLNPVNQLNLDQSSFQSFPALKDPATLKMLNSF